MIYQAKKPEENQGKIQKLEEESKSEEPLQKIEEAVPLEKEEKAKKSALPLEKQETTETVMQTQKTLERRETNESGGKAGTPYKVYLLKLSSKSIKNRNRIGARKKPK